MNANLWAQVQEIYYAALERSEEHRSSYVAEACGGDAELRSEVESLLARDESPSAVIDRPAWEDAEELLNGLVERQLSVGAELGPYRITGTLGVGGMGHVYSAVDTKLGRSVAIKVNNGGFEERFVREAKLLASLNHPNIATLYGVEDDAMVMELVDGITLREKMHAGPISLGEAMPWIEQLIDALDYAHANGVIHRDLKPANIKLTPAGVIKVLDFGLGKSISPAARFTDNTVRAAPESSPGVILGTNGYMAPEQARGQPVDKRADIWAFGVVVYELVTGRRLFEGGTGSDTLAQTLTREVDFSPIPRRLVRLLRRCLDRDPKSRLRDIGDARALLDEPVEKEAGQSVSRGSRLSWLVALAACLLAAVTLLQFWRKPPLPVRPVMISTLDFPSGLFLSPDGKYVLKNPEQKPSSVGPFQLRKLNELTWRDMQGTEGGQWPFWSNDSSAVGYFANGQIRLFLLSTQESRPVAQATALRGASWRGSPVTGDIIYSTGAELYHLPLSTGTARRLPITPQSGEEIEIPVFLPEGDGFVFLMGPKGAHARALYRATLTSAANPARLLDTSFRVTYARHPHTGSWHMFYNPPRPFVLGGPFMTVPVNPRTGESLGPPVALVEDTSVVAPTRFPTASVSNNGVMLFRRTSTSMPIWKLRWFDRTGNVLAAPGEHAQTSSFALSPDESRAALRTGFPKEHVAILDLKSGQSSRLSSSPLRVGNPLWSPDGKWIYYTLERSPGERQETVVRHAADGRSSPEILSHSPNDPTFNIQAVTPDGHHLLGLGDSGLYVFDLRAPAGTPPRLALPASSHFRPWRLLAMMESGKWILVWSQSTPTAGYFIRWPLPADGVPPVHPVSNREIIWGFFRPDDQEICGISFDRTKVSCQQVKEVAGTPQLGPPVPQFAVSAPGRSDARVGSFSRDGTRLLILSTDQSEENKVHLISDWTALLSK